MKAQYVRLHLQCSIISTVLANQISAASTQLILTEWHVNQTTVFITIFNYFLK